MTDEHGHPLRPGERYRVAFRSQGAPGVCVESLHFLGAGPERSYWIPAAVNPDVRPARPQGIVIPTCDVRFVGSTRDG